MSNSQFYNLWNPPPRGQRVTPLDNTIIDESKLEEAIQKMLIKQENCDHLRAQRWGPSYVLRFDGSFREIDSYACSDCETSSKEPIGSFGTSPPPKDVDFYTPLVSSAPYMPVSAMI